MAADHRDTLSAGANDAPAGNASSRGSEAFGSSRGGELVPGSLASLDSTLPPTPLKDLLAADGASVYVFSSDEDLVDAVQKAGGDQYPVVALDEWTVLLGSVGNGRSRIVLLDADALSVPLQDALDELHAASPSLVVLAAARRDEAQSMMGLLSDRQIHRLLIKPAALGITRLLLESAVARYLQLRESPEHMPELRAEPLRRRRKAPRSALPAWLVATAVVFALGVAAVGRFADISMPWRRESPPQRSVSIPSAAPRPVSGSEAVGAPLDELFADAERALLGDSLDAAAAALDAIRRAQPSSSRLAFLEAQLERARAASTRAAPSEAVEPPGRTTAADDVAADDSAAAAVDTAAAAGGPISPPAATSAPPPAAEATAETGGDATAAPGSAANASPATEPSRPEAAAEDVAPASFDAEPGSPDAALPDPVAATELRGYVTLARTRLQQDRLLQPEGDSARDYLERAAALSGSHPDVLRLRADLAAAVVATARLALDIGSLAQATRFAEEAARLGADPEAVALLDLDLTAARTSVERERRRQLLAEGRARLEQGSLIAPRDDGALHHLAALRAEAPDFPGLEEPWQDLLERLTADVGRAIDAGDWQAAARITAALEAAGAEPELAASLEAEWLQARYLATPAPAGTLRVLESVPPVYPEIARRIEAEGWVDVDFVVDTDGRTRDITVLDSQPGDRFDEAAVEAIRLQRYEPFELEGRRYARRLQLRIRFTLD